MSDTSTCALAIDPGKNKCGVAVVRRAGSGTPPDFEVVHREVVERASICDVVQKLCQRCSPDVILIGDGTTHKECRSAVEELCRVSVQVVDEKNSTLLARKRFFQEHSPRGIRRFIPTSMQTPQCPYDDYVAVILAESFLLAHS